MSASRHPGPGDLVVIHLAQPGEKYWGVLLALDGVGATVQAIGLDSFEDWMRQFVGDGPVALGLSTLFVPIQRIERIYLDERVGQVESYAERFERFTGRSVLGVLDPA